MPWSGMSGTTVACCTARRHCHRTVSYQHRDVTSEHQNDNEQQDSGTVHAIKYGVVRRYKSGNQENYDTALQRETEEHRHTGAQ